MIYFNCKNCGTTIKVSSQFAGKRGKCARCGVTNDIPLESEKGVGPRQPEAAPPAPSARPAPAPAEVQPTPPRPGGEAPAEAPSQPRETPAEPTPAGPPPAQPPRAPSELPLPARQIDQLIGHLRRRGGRGVFATVEKVSYVLSVYVVLALAPFMLVVGLSVLPGRTSEFWTQADKIQMCLTLVIAALLLPLCQYVIAKVRAAAVRIVRSSPSSISSTNLLDCIAVLLLVGGVVALGGGAYLGYETRQWGTGALYGVGGLLAAAICFLLASVALNPSELNIVITPRATAGQEAVGFLSFFWKVALRFGPVILLVQILASLGLLAWAAYQAVRYESVQALGAVGTSICLGLMVFTAAYVLVYLLFLGYHLLVDLIRAVFQIAANTRPRERGRRGGRT